MPDYTSIIYSKLPRIKDSIFSTVTKYCNEKGAINLAQGFPELPTPEKLIELTYQNMKAGRNQYAAMPGIMELREGIANFIQRNYKAEYNPEDEITVTAGGTQAIYTAISAFIRDEDEVIVFEPAYDCYTPAIKVNGGLTVYVELYPPNFDIDWNIIKRALTQRTRMIIVNTPHNPTGRIFTKHDMDMLHTITAGTDIIILSDEVYENIIFDGKKHLSLCEHAGLAERTLIVSSFGKSFNNTGWKVGYIYGPHELMREFRKVHQFNVFSINTPVQYALAEFIKDNTVFDSISEIYQQKRDLFVGLLKGSKFKFKTAESTYFQLLDYSEISEEKDEEFIKKLIDTVGVATIPLSPFFHMAPKNKIIRVCFAKDDETLKIAAEKLCKI